MGSPSFLGINLIDVAILVLWSIICFSIGRIYGRYEKYEPNTELTEEK